MEDFPPGSLRPPRGKMFAARGGWRGRGPARSCAWLSRHSRSMSGTRPGKRLQPRRCKTGLASPLGTSSLGDLSLTMVRSEREGGQRVRGTGWTEGVQGAGQKLEKRKWKFVWIRAPISWHPTGRGLLPVSKLGPVGEEGVDGGVNPVFVEGIIAVF